MSQYYVRYRGYENELDSILAIGEFIVSQERERKSAIIMWLY